MIVGPLLGGFLYDVWLVMTHLTIKFRFYTTPLCYFYIVYKVGGYKLPFLSMGGTLFLSALVAIIVLPKKSSDETTSVSTSDKSHGIWNFVQIPVVWMTSFGIVTAATGVGFLSALIEPHLRKVWNNFP